MAQKLGRPHNFRALSKPKQLRKGEHRHYLPYIPVLLLVVGTFLLCLGRPAQKQGVLAYATDVNQSGLLQATNSEREKHTAPDLQINSMLSAAAQAKANDMVARNYWSHTTPDGQQPWTFMDSAGYKYEKAGENLAYGFLASDEAVAGWMNSPTHRQNLLDAAYTEVGFGFANSENYNKSGKETVVVALYGKPLVLGASSQPVNQTSLPSGAIVVAASSAKSVSRIQAITHGEAPWVVFAVGLITGLAVALLLIKHAAGLRHLLKNSERFVLRHPLLDTVLVSLVLIGSFLSQTTGFIH